MLVQRVARIEHALVVLAIFLGQVLGIEIEVGFAEDFLVAVPERLAELAIDERELTLPVLAKDVDRQRVDQRMIQRLGLAQGLLGQFRLGVVAAVEVHIVGIGHGRNHEGIPFGPALDLHLG